MLTKPQKLTIGLLAIVFLLLGGIAGFFKFASGNSNTDDSQTLGDQITLPEVSNFTATSIPAQSSSKLGPSKLTTPKPSATKKPSPSETPTPSPTPSPTPTPTPTPEPTPTPTPEPTPTPTPEPTPTPTPTPSSTPEPSP